MGSVRALYGRFRELIHDAARFSAVGTFGFVCTLTSSFLLHVWAGIGPLISSAIGIAVGAAISYAGNRYWTFRHRQHAAIRGDSIRYLTIHGAGLVVQFSCVAFTAFVLRQHGALSYDVALVIGTGLGAVIRFWSCREWVWPPHRPVPS
jgi:putative flippase GtrA